MCCILLFLALIVIVIMIVTAMVHLKQMRRSCGCMSACQCTNESCPCCGSAAQSNTSTTRESFNINNNRVVTLHYTNWCVHCKNMRQIWERVKAAIAGPGVEFREVDEDLAKTPGIGSYPTIMMVLENGHVVKYLDGPDFISLRNWIVAPTATYVH